MKIILPIRIEEIKVSDNRRKTDDEKVKELAASIKEIGLINPITVTDIENGYQLVAGLHRLRAYKLLGEAFIMASVMSGTDLELELVEIDENLIRNNDLNYMGRGDYFNRRDEILKEMGIRAKVGDNQYTKSGSADFAVPKTTKDIAKEMGISERKLYEEKQIARDTIPEAKEVIREKQLPKKTALELAREEPETQKKIIPLFESGQTKKVEEAKKILSPAEEEYQEKNKQIDKKYDNHKLVADLINNMKFVKIDEQCVSDYMDTAIDIFQAEFVQNCDRLINKLNEMKGYHLNITKVRRVK